MGGQLFSQGADGDVPFFGVSFSLIFPGTGYQNKAIFLEPLNNVIPMTTGSKFHSQESLGTTAGQHGAAGAVWQA